MFSYKTYLLLLRAIFFMGGGIGDFYRLSTLVDRCEI